MSEQRIRAEVKDKLAAGKVIFALLAVLSSAVVLADTVADVERMEDKRAEAVLKADMPTLYSIYAEDFFYNRAGGDSLTREQYLPMYGSGELKVLKMTGEGRTVKAYGDSAIVTGIVHVDATIKGEARTLHLRYMNVWVKRQGAWVLVARQATNIPMKN